MGVEGLVLGGHLAAVPTFFPSVSSVKANARPSEYLRLLIAAGEPRFLVSAYDIATADLVEQTAMQEVLAEAKARGADVLLDSGNYEAYWNNDRQWSASRLAGVLKTANAPIAFCLDEQQPSNDSMVAAEEIVGAVFRDQAATPHTTVCPIVHGRTVDSLVESVRLVAARLQPILLGVAERELGDGILRRGRSIRRLRATLDDVAPLTSLHILGTGSPMAIAIFAISGAQSFDGLEWCHTCVDPDTVRLHHFQHRDLVRTLDPSLTSDLGYVPGTLLHNLLFFRSWLDRIRSALQEGTAETLLESVLPPARRKEVLNSVMAL